LLDWQAAGPWADEVKEQTDNDPEEGAIIKRTQLKAVLVSLAAVVGRLLRPKRPGRRRKAIRREK